MRPRTALVLIIFLIVSACTMPVGSETPTPVGPTPVGPTSVGPTPVGPTAVGPTSVVPTLVSSGFENLSASFAQLPDGSTAIQFKGGDVRNPDGFTTEVDPFWITSAPITNQQYELCVQAGICSAPDDTANPSFIPVGAVYPVTGLTVQQAQAYCTWQGGTLPTSAQTIQADQGTLQVLEFLFASHTQGLTFLPLGPGNEHEASACDFVPAGTAGCPPRDTSQADISACDLVPAGTEGCPPDEPSIAACDLLPAGTAGCSKDNESQGDEPTACDFVPAGTAGCPDNESDLQACDLLPGGCPSDAIQACDLLPGGCPPESSDTLATLLAGLLSAPDTSYYGYFSDDTTGGGTTSYQSPLGQIITVNASVHPGDITFKCVIPNPKIHAPYCQGAAYIPNTKGNYPPPVCKDVTLDPKGTYCSSDLPFVNVNVSKDADFVWAEPSPANCSLDPVNSTATKDRFYCTGPQAALITIYGQNQCSAPADWDPQKTCLDGYSYDDTANTCMYTGSQTDTQNCPSGFSYSADEMCCVAAGDYKPVCAPGYYNSPLGCVEYASTYLTVESTVEMPVCTDSASGTPTKTPGGQNPGPSCNVTCNPGEVLDIASCSCNPYKP